MASHPKIPFFNCYSGGWSPIGCTRQSATNRPIVATPGDYDDGEIGGMIGKGNRSTRGKPAPVPLCPPQTPLAARTRTRGAAMGSLSHRKTMTFISVISAIFIRIK
jgi:hypothetical protein